MLRKKSKQSFTSKSCFCRYISVFGRRSAVSKRMRKNVAPEYEKSPSSSSSLPKYRSVLKALGFHFILSLRVPASGKTIWRRPNPGFRLFPDIAVLGTHFWQKKNQYFPLERPLKVVELFPQTSDEIWHHWHLLFSHTHMHFAHVGYWWRTDQWDFCIRFSQKNFSIYYQEFHLLRF